MDLAGSWTIGQFWRDGRTDGRTDGSQFYNVFKYKIIDAHCTMNSSIWRRGKGRRRKKVRGTDIKRHTNALKSDTCSLARTHARTIKVHSRHTHLQWASADRAAIAGLLSVVSAVGAAIASSLPPSLLPSFSPCRLFWGIGRGRVKQQHSGGGWCARRGAARRSQSSFIRGCEQSHAPFPLSSPFSSLLFPSRPLLVFFYVS